MEQLLLQDLQVSLLLLQLPTDVLLSNTSRDSSSSFHVCGYVRNVATGLLPVCLGAKRYLLSISSPLFLLGPPTFLLVFAASFHLLDAPLLFLLTTALFTLLLPPHLAFTSLLLRIGSKLDAFYLPFTHGPKKLCKLLSGCKDCSTRRHRGNRRCLIPQERTAAMGFIWPWLILKKLLRGTRAGNKTLFLLCSHWLGFTPSSSVCHSLSGFLPFHKFLPVSSPHF